jgi:hypothetical protein
MKQLIYCLLFAAFFISSCNKDPNPEGSIVGKYLVDSLYQYRHSSPDDSILDSRVYYTYDNKGRTVKFSAWGLRAGTTIWDGGIQYESKYNESGSLLKKISYEWNMLYREWRVNTSLSNTYNSRNQLVSEEIFYTQNNGFGDWGEKREHTLNKNGIEVVLTDYSWISNNSWIPVRKTEFQLDGNGFQESSMSYSWNSIDNIWEILGKASIISDAEGRVIESEYSSYDSNTGVFTKSNYNLKAYDSYGNKILDETYKCIDGICNSGTFKMEYEYNSDGKILIKKRYSWDGNSFLVLSQAEYTYDSEQNLTRHEIFSSFGLDHLEAFYKEDIYYDSNGGRYFGILYEWKMPYVKIGSTVYYSSKHSVLEQSRKSYNETNANPNSGDFNIDDPVNYKFQ